MATITVLTADIDPAFDRLFLDYCENKIRCNPRDLLGVMFSESNAKASAHNRNGNASGLIQFMPATLLGLGWKRGDQAFRCLSASQQLPYVVSYFAPWQAVGGPFDSAARIYQAVFLPGTLKIAKGPDDMIATHGGFLGWAYDANALFDVNGDGKITIGELDLAVRRNAKGARWREMLARLGLEDWPDATDEGIYSVLDVQRALNRLAIAPEGQPYPYVNLVEDGIDGPNTRRAVRAFQTAKGLHVDGIAGRQTRPAIAAALAALNDAPDDDESEGPGENEEAAQAT